MVALLALVLLGAAPAQEGDRWRDLLAWKLSWFGITMPAAAQTSEGQSGLIRTMASEQHGGVFDNAGLLKPGGKRDLVALTRQWEARGKRLWIVTVPATESPDAAAEAIYGSLSMGERDVLIVLSPRRVYAKTLALPGERATLSRLAEESRRGFNANYAQGLAEYAGRIEDRIEARRRGARRLRTGTMIGFVLGLAVGTVLLARSRQLRREAMERAYATRLQEATDLLSEAAVEYDLGATREQNDRLAALSDRLESARRASDRSSTTELDGIIAEARALLDELRNARANAGEETQHGDTETRRESTDPC
jgi:hypothetical protein